MKLTIELSKEDIEFLVERHDALQAEHLSDEEMADTSVEDKCRQFLFFYSDESGKWRNFEDNPITITK